jgi:hypothetical protein
MQINYAKSHDDVIFKITQKSTNIAQQWQHADMSVQPVAKVDRKCFVYPG